MIMFPDEPVDAKTPHPLMRELDERGRRPGESVVAMLRRVLDERDRALSATRDRGSRMWRDSPVNAAVVLAGYVVGALITGVGVALQAWALLGMGLALGGAALLHASACTQRPDVPMLFRIGGPAWKTLGLLLGDEQRVSRGKALEVLRRLAMGDMTEAECEAWVREVSA